MVLSPDAYRPCISATTPRVSSVSTSVTVRRGLVTNRSIRAMTHAITSSTSSGYTVIQLSLSIIFVLTPDEPPLGRQAPPRGAENECERGGSWFSDYSLGTATCLRRSATETFMMSVKGLGYR